MSILAERGAKMYETINTIKKYALWFIIGAIIGSVAVAVLSERLHAGRLRDAEADYLSRTAAVEDRSQQLAERVRELEGQLDASQRDAAELREQLERSIGDAEQLRSQLSASRRDSAELRNQLASSQAENSRLREQLTAATDQLDGAIGTGGAITRRIERITELVRELQSGSGKDD